MKAIFILISWTMPALVWRSLINWFQTEGMPCNEGRFKWFMPRDPQLREAAS